MSFSLRCHATSSRPSPCRDSWPRSSLNLDADAQRDFIALVQAMRVDRIRVLEHAVWSEEQLSSHHRTTFTLSVNLMLTTAGCSARAEEVPALIDALAWCSVFRDLDEDLRKGLNNVPAGADIAEWTHASHARACILLENAKDEIARLDDPARGASSASSSDRSRSSRRKYGSELVRPAGFEPATSRSGGERSIQLSYGRIP